MSLKIAILLAGIVSVHAQGTFKNLNFEAATVSPAASGGYPNPVPVASALPEWTAYLGTSKQTQVQYNTGTLGLASISLLGPTWNTIDPGIIGGSYSVILQSGVDSATQSIIQNASIEQNGTVPMTAESLEFKAWNPYGSLSVSFAGDTLQLVSLSSDQTSSGQQYTLYGANISQFAGQMGELQFTSIFSQAFPYAEIDDITFSTTAVPEPSPVVLTGIGGGLFALYRWRKKRRSALSSAPQIP
jgi:hypothetical protein